MKHTIYILFFLPRNWRGKSFFPQNGVRWTTIRGKPFFPCSSSKAYHPQTVCDIWLAIRYDITRGGESNPLLGSFPRWAVFVFVLFLLCFFKKKKIRKEVTITSLVVALAKDIKTFWSKKAHTHTLTRHTYLRTHPLGCAFITLLGSGWVENYFPPSRDVLCCVFSRWESCFRRCVGRKIYLFWPIVFLPIHH